MAHVVPRIRSLAFVAIIGAVLAVACSTQSSSVDATDPGPAHGANGASGSSGDPASANCNDSCGNAQVCSDGACVDLPKSCPCPLEAYCDLTSNACKVGCTAPTGCNAGRYCDLGTRSCKDGCGIDRDCPAGLFCDLAQHQCARGCRVDPDCKQPTHGTVSCERGACSTKCETKFHACSGDCKSDTDATACGASCTACPTRTHATAACTTGACKSTCDRGFHDCAGACAASSDVATCGTSCSPCPTPAHGTSTCDGSACGIACDPGYVRSGSTCVLPCESSPCSGVTYCDGTSHLCLDGCVHHSQCPSEQFCNVATHGCEISWTWGTETAPYCPTGYTLHSMCTAGGTMCTNVHLPASTTYAFFCASGLQSRGHKTSACGTETICMPND